VIDKEKSGGQIIIEPQLLCSGRTNPFQTEAEPYEGENDEHISSRGMSMRSSSKWFASGSDDMYVVNYTHPKPETPSRTW
jgi:hypothetical protein